MRHIFKALVFILILSNQAQSQKLEAEGFTIELKDFIESDRDMGNLKVKALTGIADITKGKFTIEYKFIVPIIDGKLTNVAVRGLGDEELFPKLRYDETDKSFTYDDKKEPALKTADTKEIILSAMYIWAKLKHSDITEALQLTQSPVAERKAVPIRNVLKPTYEGGIEGDSKVEIPVPPMPAYWEGIAIQYHKTDDPNNLPVNTYLVWNTKTREGIIINPLKKDIPFVIETAEAQKDIRWLYVMDTHTYFNDATVVNPRLKDKPSAYKPAERLLFNDFDNLLKDKNETIAVDEIATKLGSAPLVHGLNKHHETGAGPLRVFRRNIPADTYMIVSWGPFLFSGENYK